MRPWLLPLLLAACASPGPPEPPASRNAPEAAVCRSEDGRVLRQDPRVGAQTGLPTPRSIYTRRATSFRAGPNRDEAELFLLEKPSSVVILRECGFYRLARVPDGRTGWLQASVLTTRPLAQEHRATPLK
jgi:SH3-like domain-containing protein